MADATNVQGGAQGDGAGAGAGNDAGNDAGQGASERAPVADAAAAAAAAPADTGGGVDWRLRIAGDDGKLLKQLERYSTEADFGKAHASLQGKLSSGEYRRAPPKDAAPEDIAAWRAELGLPEKPEAYMESLALPDGVVPSDADKAALAEFASAAFGSSVDHAGFGAMVSKYYELQDRQRAAREDRDAAFQSEAEDVLREAWKGPDFRRNKNAIENMLSKWPDGAAANLLAGRMDDGSRIGDNPVFAQILAQIANRIEPGRTLVPDGFTPASQGLDRRIAGIEALMGDRHSEYWKGPKAEAMQSEYRELVEARNAGRMG